MTFEERIDEFNKLIENSNYIVFFGGAGVSTDSGIPDFRSTNGLYNQNDVNFEGYSPEYLLSNTCWRKEPKVFHEFYRQKLDCRNIEPNTTHKVLADMEKKGKLAAVITQNIDGLHQKAGSEEVWEIHGTTSKNYCVSCHLEYPGDYIFDCGEDVPKCECGGRIRPDVTLYEESLPDDAWYMAQWHLNKADLIIIGGTSLSVYPAASLILGRGCPIVLINKDETDMPRLSVELYFNEGLSEVFSNIKY